MKNFEKEIKQENYIRELYNTAKEHGDEETMELAKKKYNDLREQIEDKGKEYCTMYSLFKNADERGNDVIDLYDTTWTNRITEFMEMARKYDVKEFTVSSGYSSMNEVVWGFIQHGCELKGMELVGSAYTETDFDSPDFREIRPAIPAFLFDIK